MRKNFAQKMLKNNLAPRMVAWTLLCGIIATAVVTFIQVSFEYTTGIQEIEETMNRIEATMSAPIANALWNVDHDGLKVTIQGMLNHPDLKKLEIYNRGGQDTALLMSAGQTPESDYLEHTFNIYAPGQLQSAGSDKIKPQQMIATVKITATTKNLQMAIMRRTALILMTQGAKALVMALLIYFFMNVEILEPLAKLADHVKTIRPNERTAPFKLSRFIPDADDEISRLDNAIRSLDHNTKDAYDKLTKELRSKKDMQSKVIQMAHEAGIAEAATGILHDVANMTNGNMLYIELMKVAVKNADPAIKTKIDDAINKLEQRITLTGKIIKAQQSMAGKAMTIETSDVTDIINDALVLEEWQNKKNNVRVTQNIEKDANVRLNRPQFVSVLVNLLKNARESIIDANRDSGLIAINVKIQGQYCVITVIDNGMGASRETLAKIFSRGFTTKESGHGFGLAASIMVVKSFGGTMIIDSEGEGKGATVTITLPQAEFAPGELPIQVQEIQKSA